MDFEAIKGTYDVIVSLGSSCSPAIQLKRLSLRKFSGPLDWCVSLKLSDVNRLLGNRFANFMDIRNLHVMERTHYWLEDGEEKRMDDSPELIPAYFVKDNLYQVLSVHDFPILPGQPWYVTYPSYKTKLDRRIRRFLDNVMNAPSVLFVRWQGKYEEAYVLQEILAGLVKGKFTVLLLSPEEQPRAITELPWGLNRTCALSVPDEPNNELLWNYVLNGVSVSLPETIGEGDDFR